MGEPHAPKMAPSPVGASEYDDSAKRLATGSQLTEAGYDVEALMRDLRPA